MHEPTSYYDVCIYQEWRIAMTKELQAFMITRHGVVNLPARKKTHWMQMGIQIETQFGWYYSKV